MLTEYLNSNSPLFSIVKVEDLREPMTSAPKLTSPTGLTANLSKSREEMQRRVRGEREEGERRRREDTCSESLERAIYLFIYAMTDFENTALADIFTGMLAITSPCSPQC